LVYGLSALSTVRDQRRHNEKGALAVIRFEYLEKDGLPFPERVLYQIAKT